MPFLLLFILTPIIEMWVLITVGSKIGALPTIGLVLLTAVIGLALLRQQGLSTLFRARAKVAEGGLPMQEMVEGMFLAVGGALLLTPGFVTDAIGFACLIPGLRQLLIGSLLKRVTVVSSQTYSATYTDAQGQGGGSPKDKSGHTIEGDYRREP